jgi:hypothetical protein
MLLILIITMRSVIIVSVHQGDIVFDTEELSHNLVTYIRFSEYFFNEKEPKFYMLG